MAPNDPAQTAANAQTPEALTGLIDRLAEVAAERERLSFDDLVAEIGTHGHAPLLMVVALLMVLPLGMIPGVGGALGVLAAVIGVHMIVGRDRIALPSIIGKRDMPSETLCKVLDWIRPGAVWISGLLKRRLTFLAETQASVVLIALVLIVFGGSLVILGALPVAVPLIGFPIALFSLGLLTKDGAAVAGGWVILGLAVAGGIAWTVDSMAA